MTSCTTRLRSAPKVAPVPRKPFIEKKSTCYSSVPPRYLWFINSRKTLPSEFVFIYAYLTERAPRRRDHCWRSSYVIDRTSQDSHVCEKHFPGWRGSSGTIDVLLGSELPASDRLGPMLTSP